jgi:tetratricopeptide (TPR) repeat protein
MPSDSELLAAGLEHHRSGQFGQAQAIYSRLLAANPQNAVVFNLLGAVCINLSQFQQAAGYLDEAMRLDPNYAAVHDNWGVLLMAQNRFAEAIIRLRKAVALDSQRVPTRVNLAKALAANGQLAEATAAYAQVVQMAPGDPIALGELARLTFAQGRMEESLPHFRDVVRLSPGDARAHLEWADALAQTGRRTESIAAYLELARVDPASTQACLNLCHLYMEEREFDEAERWARRAVELQPSFAEGYRSLGTALTRWDHYDEAFAVLHQATALDHPAENPATLYRLGNVYFQQGDLTAALAHYDRALALRPDYADARLSRSVILLSQGDLVQGFREYEWRMIVRKYLPFDPPWRFENGQSLEGRTILLCSEQGFGDTFQFVRYAAALKERGARVLFGCRENLLPILGRTPGIDGWATPEAGTVAADCSLPLLSAPFRMQTTLEGIPAKVPYIFADPDLVESWRQKLAGCDGFKVGIVWQGNPEMPDDRTRSIPLAHFAPLAKVPGVRLVNLQKGYGIEQLKEVAREWSVVDFCDDVDQASGAFMDTAAIIKNLDLVITSDTVTAHLAGALGANVWLVLKKTPDWRWLLDRPDSPWYPTMRLFRQTEAGDWPEVFGRIATQLEKLVAQSTNVRSGSSRVV